MAIRYVLLVVVLINLILDVMGDPDYTGLGFLSPLIPISHITGNSGMITAGFTGAALLQLTAAAGLATYLRKRRNSRSYRHRRRQSNYHQDRSLYVRDNEFEYGVRRRRNLNTNNMYSDKPSEFSDERNMYDVSFDDVLQYDQLGCGLRLVCELSATPEDNLLDDEKLILSLFGNGNDKLPNPNKTSRGKINYSYAAILGSHSEDMNICSKVYGRCPYTGKQVMQTLRDANL